MPQMSPMWWTMMMMIFLISMLMAMSLVYFSYKKLIKKDMKMKKTSFNWLW
nr:ATP synthase F0 subunit 8 [Yangida basnetti]